MKFIKINPLEFSIEPGESWWPIHPNNANCEFNAPVGAVTFCMKSLLDFKAGTVYTIVGNDSNHGWITVACTEEVIEMPYYLFARHFDAEAFVRGTLVDPSVLERATPFDYKATLPHCRSFERNEG
jgi:hypothetical protein